VRRLVLLSMSLTLVAVVSSCNDDGRTLREPDPDAQDLSISTTAAPTMPEIIDGGALPNTIPLDTLPAEEPLALTAPWRDGAAIDERHTCDDANLAPALSWSPAPVGTVEIALTMVDVDAPEFTHWVLAGLAPNTIAVSEGTVPVGAVEALNSVGTIGYTGPCPPAGSTHTYVVTVHYLGEQSGLDDGESGPAMIERLNDIQVASAEVSGTFSRPAN